LTTKSSLLAALGAKLAESKLARGEPEDRSVHDDARFRGNPDRDTESRGDGGEPRWAAGTARLSQRDERA
jgi:hypothetical protein